MTSDLHNVPFIEHIQCYGVCIFLCPFGLAQSILCALKVVRYLQGFFRCVFCWWCFLWDLIFVIPPHSSLMLISSVSLSSLAALSSLWDAACPHSPVSAISSITPFLFNLYFTPVVSTFLPLLQSHQFWSVSSSDDLFCLNAIWVYRWVIMQHACLYVYAWTE